MRIKLKQRIWTRKQVGSVKLKPINQLIIGNPSLSLPQYTEPSDLELYDSIDEIDLSSDAVRGLVTDVAGEFLYCRFSQAFCASLHLLIDVNFIRCIMDKRDEELRVIYPQEFKNYFKEI